MQFDAVHDNIRPSLKLYHVKILNLKVNRQHYTYSICNGFVRCQNALMAGSSDSQPTCNKDWLALQTMQSVGSGLKQTDCKSGNYINIFYSMNMKKIMKGDSDWKLKLKLQKISPILVTKCVPFSFNMSIVLKTGRRGNRQKMACHPQ